MDKNNVKALYRKGTALNDLGNWDDAKEVLLQCIHADPKNAPAKRALQDVKDTIAKHTKKLRGAYAGMFDKLAAARPPTPPPVKRPDADSDSDGVSEDEGANEAPAEAPATAVDGTGNGDVAPSEAAPAAQ